MKIPILGKLVLFALALLCGSALELQAQNLTTVTASSIQQAGSPLSSGTLCFQATDANARPISFQVGGGGQMVTAPYCTAVTAGAIGSFTVANPASTIPANIQYTVTIQNTAGGQILKYTNVKFTGSPFNFDTYVPGANLPFGASQDILTLGKLIVTGSCSYTGITGCGGGGGGGSFYQTFQNAASALTQRATANFFSGITCADNSGQSRTDCQVDTSSSFNPAWAGNHTFNGNTNIAGGFKINGAAAAGKIPIGDGTNFVPGDPLVQGLNAEGSTATNNPVNVGGFDTAGTPAIHGTKVLNGAPAGTEYGIVTRPIPSGTQTVSGTVTANAGTGTFNIQANASMNETQVAGTAIDVNSGNKSAGTQRVVLATDQPQLTNALKVDGSAVTQPVSGTVTANAGTGTFNIQANASVNETQLAGTAIDVNSGVKSAGTQRIVIATDQPQLTNPLKVDGSAVTQPTNVTQFGSNAVATGTGASGVGIPRVTISNDSSLAANQSVNTSQVGGTNTDTNTGNASAGTQRVVLASNQPAVAISAASLPLPTNAAQDATLTNRSAKTQVSNGTNEADVKSVPPTGNEYGVIVRDPALVQLVAALAALPVPANFGYLRGSFGQRITSTGTAIDVHVKDPPPSGDPCSGVKKTNIPISQTANTRLVVGGAGKVWICNVLIVGADAENISLVEGTGSTCGTATLGVIGGTTAANGTNLAANGGYAEGDGLGSIANTAVPGDDLCLLQSGSGRVSGHINIVFAP